MSQKGFSGGANSEDKYNGVVWGGSGAFRGGQISGVRVLMYFGASGMRFGCTFGCQGCDFDVFLIMRSQRYCLISWYYLLLFLTL